MKAPILALLVAATSLPAIGQPAPHPCQLEADTKERTECLLRAFPALPPATAAAIPSGQPRPSDRTTDNPEHAPRLYLHSSATVTDFGTMDLGEDGAQFAASRSGGDTAAVVDAGALMVFPAFNRQGWQPFAYASWSRDEAADDPSDVRTVGLGLRGFFSRGPTSGPGQRDNLRIYTTANLAQRTDLYGDSDATQLGVKLSFLTLNWADPLPGTPGFVPHLGWVLEHRDAGGGATTDGTWSSLYLGSTFSYRLPGDTLKGFGLTALVRWFGDVASPGDNDRRSDGFGKIKLTYDLYENASSIAKPAIFLARQAGDDILSGTSKAKTTFGLQLTVR